MKFFYSLSEVYSFSIPSSSFFTHFNFSTPPLSDWPEPPSSVMHDNHCVAFPFSDQSTPPRIRRKRQKITFRFIILLVPSTPYSVFYPYSIVILTIIIYNNTLPHQFYHPHCSIHTQPSSFLHPYSTILFPSSPLYHLFSYIPFYTFSISYCCNLPYDFLSTGITLSASRPA